VASKEDLLSKANKPAEDAMKLHPFYRGKMQTLPRCAIRSMDDFAIWYTPGGLVTCKNISPSPLIEGRSPGNNKKKELRSECFE
jgi:malate dehydrogenase (oxaloacetate-decarboxylating)